MEKTQASENLKKYLALAKKHHFWILSLLVILVAVPVYTIEADSLRQAREQNEREIDNWRGQVEQLRGSVNAEPAERPKNQKFIDGLNEEGNLIKNQAFAVWEEAYQQQQEHLHWPKDVAEIEQLGPDEEISERSRGNYGNFIIPKEWQRIFDKVRLRRPRSGAQQPPGAPPTEFEGIVEWDEAKRNNIMHRTIPSALPSTLRVRITQEELWIFESLVDIINQVNGQAKDMLAAKIRKIEELEIGKPAIESVLSRPAGNISIPGVTDVANPGGFHHDNAQDGKDEKAMLLSGRYLDANNMPVSAQQFESNPPFTEFKQVFVVMRLVMDQREIPTLLAACANSYLPIEPRQVWMEFHDIDTQAVKDPNQGGRTAPAVDPGRGHYDCMVEIRGIVYLYNPPDLEKLGKGSAPNPAKRSPGIPTTSSAAPAMVGF